MELCLIKLTTYSINFYIKEKFKNYIHSLNVMGHNILYQRNLSDGILS